MVNQLTLKDLCLGTAEWGDLRIVASRWEGVTGEYRNVQQFYTNSVQSKLFQIKGEVSWAKMRIKR